MTPIIMGRRAAGSFFNPWPPRISQSKYVYFIFQLFLQQIASLRNYGPDFRSFRVRIAAARSQEFVTKFTQLRDSWPGQAVSVKWLINLRHYAITGACGSQGWCKFTSLPRNREEWHVMDSQESRRTCEAHLLLWIPGMELCPPGEGLWLRNGLVYGIR